MSSYRLPSSGMPSRSSTVKGRPCGITDVMTLMVSPPSQVVQTDAERPWFPPSPTCDTSIRERSGARTSAGGPPTLDRQIGEHAEVRDVPRGQPKAVRHRDRRDLTVGERSRRTRALQP